MARGLGADYTGPMLRVVFIFFCMLCAAPVFAQGPVVFAAASLRTALDEVAQAWVLHGNPAPILSYAGTSSLARQIDQGAPADLVMTASADWMAWLENRDLIFRESRIALLGNTLVLAGPKGDKEISFNVSDIRDRLGDGRIAMALVDAVPAGQYGKAALEALGLWDALAPFVAQTDNVRAALALVARGEAPLGIVYLTDAHAEPRVDVLASFPQDTHPDIEILLAQVTGHSHSDAERFHAYLQTDEALAIFRSQGFR